MGNNVRNIIIINTDEIISLRSLSSFIQKTNVIFGWKEYRKPHFYFNLQKTIELDLLGAVTLYKMLEYSVSQHCFSNPTINLPDALKSSMKKYGFADLVSELIQQKDIKNEFNKLKVEINDDFFVAPIALWEGRKLTSKDWNEYLFPKINSYYKDETTSLMIFQFFTELYSNFTAHSNDKSKSIMVAHGNKDWIEIVCVDTGVGIIESLKQECTIQGKKEILLHAMQKNVSSKKQKGHMGYGLWTIDQLIKRMEGRLQIWSNGACYERLGKKRWVTDCVNWNGVILYLRFKLGTPMLFKDIENVNLNNYINFV